MFYFVYGYDLCVIGEDLIVVFGDDSIYYLVMMLECVYFKGVGMEFGEF